MCPPTNNSYHENTSRMLLVMVYGDDDHHHVNNVKDKEVEMACTGKSTHSIVCQKISGGDTKVVLHD